MLYIKNIGFGIIFHSILLCGSFSTEGMLTLSSLTSNNIPNNWAPYESSISYIPTVSIIKELSNQTMFDIEWSYYLKRDYAGDSLYNNFEKQHRLWARYSSEKLEARFGLQKIIFGPTQILRPLSWFDTFDVKDPTGRTNGVNAFRLKLFPSNNVSIWSWLIKSELNTLSLGGRTELSSTIGEFGFTLHLDPSSSNQFIGQTQTFIKDSHSRIAIDYRYDGFIGFWNESVLIRSEKSEILLSSIGADYTLPVANRVLVMTETMNISNKYQTQNNNQSYTAIMASFPIGIIHAATYISQFDWSEEKNYHYFRWSSTFDSYSLNMIFSLNPKRNTYNIAENSLPKSISGFGAGIQFIFIYNY
tara:strand:- start:18695 stop:19774 length:1080 start_codon:yes stop_codon:yes gene_type:complete